MAIGYPISNIGLLSFLNDDLYFSSPECRPTTAFSISMSNVISKPLPILLVIANYMGIPIGVVQTLLWRLTTFQQHLVPLVEVPLESPVGALHFDQPLPH